MTHQDPQVPRVTRRGAARRGPGGRLRRAAASRPGELLDHTRQPCRRAKCEPGKQIGDGSHLIIKWIHTLDGNRERRPLESALEQAIGAGGEKDVQINGGARSRGTSTRVQG